MTEKEEELWDWATEILGTLFYAIDEGDTAAIPALEDIRYAVNGLVILAGWNGLEPNVASVRRALLGPDIQSYAEIVRLTQRLLDDVKERIHQREQPNVQAEWIPRDDDLF